MNTGTGTVPSKLFFFFPFFFFSGLAVLRLMVLTVLGYCTRVLYLYHIVIIRQIGTGFFKIPVEWKKKIINSSSMIVGWPVVLKNGTNIRFQEWNSLWKDRIE